MDYSWLGVWLSFGGHSHCWMSCSGLIVVVFVMEDLLVFVDVFVILGRRTSIAGAKVMVTVTVGSAE